MFRGPCGTTSGSAGFLGSFVGSLLLDVADAGPKAWNGVNRCHAFSQDITVAGYFLPSFQSANVLKAISAASSFGAV